MKNEKTNLKNLWLNIDKYILVSTFVLIGFGLICIFSASEQLDSKWNLSSNFLFKKHIVFCFVGLIIMFSISQFSTKNLIIISIKAFYKWKLKINWFSVLVGLVISFVSFYLIHIEKNLMLSVIFLIIVLITTIFYINHNKLKIVL